MRTMHYRVLMLAAWLVFLYNLERFSKYVTPQRVDLLTPYAYGFIALVSIVTLALPVIHRLPLLVPMSVGTVAFLGLKAWFGYPLLGQGLTLTITEVGAVLITGMLTRNVISAIREFETSIVNFTIKRVGRETKAFDIEQGEMYQEVRRARAFNRPLALLAIEPVNGSLRVSMERMVEEVQQATMKQYVLAALAKLLEDELGPYSIIAQDGDKFLILLPEVSGEETNRLIAQLRGQVQDALELDLQIGAAVMPEVETFDRLVEAAYSKMNGTAPRKSEGAMKREVVSV